MTPRPGSTYRLQLQADFDLDAAAALSDYFAALGADWAYLSPILQSSDGSAHGYDVVDPTRIDDARGGAAGFARFVAAARAAGLGILVDIVPNHQGVADPQQNAWWWDVLARGEESMHAASFDIDWRFGQGRVRLPVLGAELDDVVAAGEITVAPAEEGAGSGTARYDDLVLPLAAGTAPPQASTDAATVRRVLNAQHWELCFWRRGEDLLNYRRFFTVASLAGVRVEEKAVFDASHREIARWFEEGLVDGLRIDHPDGLADPGGYLDALASLTGGAYTVVEKILEGGEELPGWWATDGTTGYDALGEIDRVLTDGAGAQRLRGLHDALAGRRMSWAEMIAGTKREVADTSQRAEVGRILREMPDGGGVSEAFRDDDHARDAIAELLAAFGVYRAYLPAGGEHLDEAVVTASLRRPDLAPALRTVAAILRSDPAGAFARRFMQTAGPVMAKGVEDRAFYRDSALTSLNEVGGDPSQMFLHPSDFHGARARRQATWPHALTALTTHDTKRSEDVRARLAVLAECPARWAEVLASLREVASTGDGPCDNLLWQAVVGAWSDDPALGERLHAYAEKAVREAGVATSWEDPNTDFEQRVHGLVDAAVGPARPIVERFVAEIVDAGRSNSLSAKLLQLAGPGIPDVYQGTEPWDLSLVDPDNRRPVDFVQCRSLLAQIDAGWQPPIDDTGAAKLLLVSRALRLRRDRPELFTRYTPLEAVGPAAAHALAFARGERGGAIAVATRLPLGLAARGGWGDTAVMLPAGRWSDVLTGREVAGGAAPVADILADYPVSLLVPA